MYLVVKRKPDKTIGDAKIVNNIKTAEKTQRKMLSEQFEKQNRREIILNNLKMHGRDYITNSQGEAVYIFEME